MMSKSRLMELSKAYYEGYPMVSDSEYDKIYAEYLLANPGDYVVGYKPSRERKLDIPMFSLNKETSIDGIRRWLTSKLGDAAVSTDLILTPKYDGISICVDEYNFPERRMATKRGDGVVGQEIDKHYSFMNTGDTGDRHWIISFGEAIMSKSVFRKYDSLNGGMYKNARNLVGSQLNMDKPNTSILKDITYLRYGYVNCSGHITSDKTKECMIDRLNKMNTFHVPYYISNIDELTHEWIMKLYGEWSKDYEIDGIVIDINSVSLSYSIGRESNMNPAHSRAYKGHFEDVAVTCVEGVKWQVAKHGKLTPVVSIESVRLNGVDVTNVTGYNARNILNHRIGEGAIVSVKRSGAVIPKIVEVHNPCDPGSKLAPTYCPSCNSLLRLYEVDLMCENDNCPEMNISRITAFFQILKCQDVGYGVIESLYHSGYTSIKSILDMRISDMVEMDKYGDKKAHKIHNAIHKCVDGISKSDLMHASGCFKNIGGSTIQLILDGNCTSSSDLYEYNRGIDDFNKFYHNIESYIKITGVQTVKTNKLAGFNVVFTGFRNGDMERIITENGGVVSNGVSSKTTHLVMAAIGSGTQKELKAEKLGIVIITGDDFRTILNNKVR